MKVSEANIKWRKNAKPIPQKIGDEDEQGEDIQVSKGIGKALTEANELKWSKKKDKVL